MRVGENIRKRRRALDMTQEDLAELSSLNKINICRIEQGRDEDRIYMRTARLIAEALGVTMEDLRRDLG